MRDALFVGLQYILPHHAISRVVYAATRVRWPAFKNAFIRVFMRLFRVDMSDAAQTSPTDFEHFNAFFTRALRDGARPLAGGRDDLVCPVDGTVSQAGPIHEGRIFQAKGHRYDLAELVGSDIVPESLAGGSFATLYLAPYNYHRIHMPTAGTLREMRYIPGRLFSVNGATASRVPRLFARNERVVCRFDTALGPMVMVLVGALNVGSIQTVWAGEVAPGRPRRALNRSYPADGAAAIRLGRGEEMGRFNMGSTVIVVLPRDAAHLDAHLTPGRRVRMGEALATPAEEASAGER